MDHGASGLLWSIQAFVPAPKCLKVQHLLVLVDTSPKPIKLCILPALGQGAFGLMFSRPGYRYRYC